MDVVAQIAPQVDRLVFAMSPATSENDRALLREVRDQTGLDNVGYLLNYAEFFLGDGMTTDLMLARMPYTPPEKIADWLASLEAAGFLASADDVWTATDNALPFLTTLRGVQRRTATELWEDDIERVFAVNEAAHAVIDAASDTHTVATAHRKLEVPDDPCLALFHQMVTLRYLRQHDHLCAWTDAGLTPEEMTVLTELWHGGAVGESEALESLVERGLASPEPDLTGQGKAVRDAIEDETNSRNSEDFVVLGEERSQRFLESLVALPPH